MNILKKKSPQQQLFNAIADSDVKKLRKGLEENVGLDINALNGRNMTMLDVCAEKILQYGQDNYRIAKKTRERKQGIGLANIWGELVNCSGTLNRYAKDFKDGGFMIIPGTRRGAALHITLPPPKASGGSSPDQPSV